MSGRRREDFITEREHTKINQVPVGRGVSGRRREDFYYQEGAQKISLPVRGEGCVGESVKILSPAGGPTAEM